jgi:hypothetical protein
MGDDDVGEAAVGTEAGEQGVERLDAAGLLSTRS